MPTIVIMIQRFYSSFLPSISCMEDLMLKRQMFSLSIHVKKENPEIYYFGFSVIFMILPKLVT